MKEKQMISRTYLAASPLIINRMAMTQSITNPITPLSAVFKAF
jgi:hypothetical protein